MMGTITSSINWLEFWLFSPALLLSKELWENTNFTTTWLVLAGGKGGGGTCVPFFVMTVAGWLIIG